MLSFLLFSLSYSQDILGDVNQDGSVDILDIIRTVNIVLEVPPEPTESEIWAADVNADADINILDVVVEVDFILGNLQLNCAEENEYLEPCTDNLTNCCYPITSHEFTWTVDTIGYAWDIFEDVAIIDENNIWVVGNVGLPDSSAAGGVRIYNAAHWNGESWQIYDLIFATSWDDSVGQVPAYAVHALSEDDIWMSAISGSYSHFDGTEWDAFYDTERRGSIYEIWGTRSDDLWFTGHNNNITHYNGESFTLHNELPEGDYYIHSIWGSDYNHVWAVSNKNNGYVGNRIYKFDGVSWDVDYWNTGPYTYPDSLSGFLSAVWGFEDTLYITCTAGLWKESVITGEGYLTEMSPTFPGATYRQGMNGNHSNDIIINSVNGKYAHFNGFDWDINWELHEAYPNLIIRNIDFKDNVFVLVGTFNYPPLLYPAIIIKGVRNE